MKNKQISIFRIIAFIMIVNISAIHVFAQEETVADVIIGCSKCVTNCTNIAINLALESIVKDEELYSDFPEGYDPYDPIAMGEVDPWDVYSAQQAEEMDRAMAEEAQRAWQEYNEPKPDISDRVIKP